MDYGKYFDFALGDDQKRTLDAMHAFLNDRNDVFILNGYAGTGKTSLVGGFIKYLCEENKAHIAQHREAPYEVNVLASTGRAAKILSDKTVVKARTIHSMLYKPTYIEDETQVIQFELFPLKVFFSGIRIYIIDEASMVGDIENPTASAARFGEGNVLKDLFLYDKNGKFLFVGDPYQLNPIGQTISPALEPVHLKTKYEKSVVTYTLNKIYRQQEDNDILVAANNLRKKWQTHVPRLVDTKYGKQDVFTSLPLTDYQRVKTVATESALINRYVSLIQEKGYNYATMLCHSNKECLMAGATVRQMLHKTRSHLIEGDLLLVTQNNYLVDLVNGDLVEVKQIFDDTRTYVAGISFVKVEVVPLHRRNLETNEDEDEYVTARGYKLYLAEDILRQGSLNLDTEQSKALMRDFIARMAQRRIYPPKKNSRSDAAHPFFVALSHDPIMNALHATYGYVLTCHKAQGGEWQEVFVNLSGNSLFIRRGKELFQWAYTAVTRAREYLHLIAARFIV
jgi:ATP-dependent exoDNAse (exonuclease V) alpha subunit